MIITKIIEIGIDLQNCIAVYSSEHALFDIIVDRYSGRCYRGCYILEVIEIVQAGDCTINKAGGNCFGTVAVRIKVRAVTYSPGEIITGCQVIRKEPTGGLICKNRYANINVEPHKSLEGVLKDQIIPLRIYSSAYNIGSTAIAVTAIALRFSNRAIIHAVSQKDVPENLSELLRDVNERILYETKIAGLNRVPGKGRPIDISEDLRTQMEERAASRNIFDQLLYSYKTRPKKPDTAIELSLDDLAEGIPDGIKFISRDQRIPGSEPKLYGYSDEIFPEGAIVQRISTGEAIIAMFEDYCAHLRTVREFTEIYNTPEIINKHRIIWKILGKSKIAE